MTDMTARERGDLCALVRKRERVMKAAAAERAAQLRADFEQQLGTIYKFDTDEIWAEAARFAKEAVAEANRSIAARCKELGIPPEFRPGLSNVGWYGRGENGTAERRAELRTMAATRIEAMRKEACTRIERQSLELQTQIAAAGLESEAARKFLEAMPAVETLMPVLEARSLVASLTSQTRLLTRY
jgi:hypothetical protein